MKRLITGKVRLGRFGLPAWAIALALLVVAAVAGQAVGPVLSGSVTGSVGMTVSQAITLDAAPSFTANSDDDFVATKNDEGTEFTIALEMEVGEAGVNVVISLGNSSGAPASALLELNVPKGIDVKLEGDGDVTEAQLSRNTWLLNLDTDTSAQQLTLTIEPKDGAAPGFYTITGRIVQIQG